MNDHEPASENGQASWQPPRRSGCIGTLGRWVLMSIIIALIVLPFTPTASRIKKALIEIARTASSTKIIKNDVTKEVEVRVPEIRVVEKVREVQVQAPPTPLPDKFVPRKEMDVTTLYNGITINTKLETSEGGHAIKEVEDPDAYKVTFNLSVRVPKANQSIEELAKINPNLPKMLPGLGKLVETGKVSGFYHKLYDTKTSLVKRDLSRLNKLLDRHNFFDCETILELKDPATARKALLIQSEMDVVADGADGDRSATLDESIASSDYYQPSTSYFWKKQTTVPNPLLARWQARLESATDELGKKGLSAERNRSLKTVASQLKAEIEDMKVHSSLIADSDPFIVLSLLFKPYIGSNEHAPQMGDYAVVIHDNQILPAICGDYGPTMKMGEASLFLAKQVNAKATPYNRGEDNLKVTYLIFPGTAKKPFGPPDLDEWKALCAQYLNELGGLGGGYAIHTWEDKFKKVEIVGPPISAMMPWPKPGADAVKAGEEIKKPGKSADGGGGKKKKG